VHPEVSKEGDRQKVDSMCRERTASWVRFNNKEQSNMMMTDIEEIDKNLCFYYEGFWEKIDSYQLPKGIYTLEDLREYGKKHNMCPYFLARHFLLQANVIVYNYSYMLDPKISNLVS